MDEALSPREVFRRFGKFQRRNLTCRTPDASKWLDVISVAVHVAPPPFLRLAGHPVRWQLLRALSASDRRVGELCELAGERQSLVSYHLRRLRDGGLVFARRSLADGRDTYYALDVARCGQCVAGGGAGVHPGLGRRAAEPVGAADVLFLCTGNSARSQMA